MGLVRVDCFGGNWGAEAGNILAECSNGRHGNFIDFIWRETASDCLHKSRSAESYAKRSRMTLAGWMCSGVSTVLNL